MGDQPNQMAAFGELLGYLRYLPLGLFGTVGVIILLIVLPPIPKKMESLKGRLDTTGKVTYAGTGTVAVDNRSGTKSGAQEWTATIKFQAQDGKTYEFGHSYGLLESELEVGDEVPVCYPPDAPEDAQFNSFMALWGSDLGAIIGALFFIVFGIIGFKMMGPSQ